jgi:Tol biopolymer transport system component
LVWFDRAGKQFGVLGDQAVYLDLGISPDGRNVATSITDPAIGPPDVWIYEVSRGLRTRFTFATEVERYPVWAPDSTRVAFSSSPVPFHIFEKSLAGIAKEGTLLESERPVFPQSWSSDGRFLAYEARGVPNTGADIWVLPLTGERKPVLFLQTSFVESSPRFSPNGRWIAYVSYESGRSEVYVAPFPGPGRKLQISSAGGQHPRWRRDGREIYYLSNDNKIVAVEVSAIGDTFEVGSSKALFETRPNRNGNVYDVSRDGRSFLVNTLAQAQTSEPLTLVVNWPAALKNKK